MRALLLLTLFLGLPSLTYAGVSVSEVAWMGSVESVNHEWIELYNSDASAVSLAGWKLTVGESVTIALAGEIPAGDYVLLERNRGDGVYLANPPFVTYTGALVNTGATITLRTGDETIVDQVVGGTDWENIGGNNTTKETAQYSGTKWITAEATPGSANKTVGSETTPSDEEEVTTAPLVRSGGGVLLRPPKKTLKLERANTELALVIDAPEIAYVGQEIPFVVTPAGPNDTILHSLLYNWNFGDGYSESGKEVTHQFLYPGEYAVNVYASYARHEQIARVTITVLPVTVSLTQNTAGDVQVHNNSPYEVPLSGFRLRGVESVIFPPRTMLLPRGTITVSKNRLQASYGDSVALYDSEGQLVATTNNTAKVSTEVVPEEVLLSIEQEAEATDFFTFTPRAEASTEPVYVPHKDADAVYGADSQPSLIEATVEAESPQESSARPVTKEPAPRETTPLIVFGLFVLLVLGAIFLTKSPTEVKNHA